MPPEADLETLARARFLDPPLTEAEFKLVRAAETGGIANCGRDLPDSAAKPARAEEWGLQRQVRADLIWWLCTNASARALVHPEGIQLWSAQVSGALELSFAKVPFPLAIVNCRIMSCMTLRQAEIPDLILNGTTVPGIEASGMQVKGNVFFRSGFKSDGEVSLLGASIGGQLDCSDATFLNSGPRDVPGGGIAIAADRISVGDGVFLNRRFRAEGEVRFPGAKIGGDFTCGGGCFIGPTKLAEIRPDVLGADAQKNYRFALTADGIAVNGDVHLDEGFSAEGEVRLLGARIAGNLDCSGARFSNPLQVGFSDNARVFAADGAEVKGCIFFRDSFYAEGDVELLGARVEKNLECIGSTFRGRVATHGASIAGGFHWLGIKNPELATLLLDDTSASRILDDVESWPLKGHLELDGFVYRRITQGPRDHHSRLDWLARQQEFTPQPYRQLAKVLRDEGDDAGARQVLYKMECQRRSEEKRVWNAPTHQGHTRKAFSYFRHLVKTLANHVWNQTLRLTIGHGYYPGRALALLLLFVALGWPLFRYGYFSRNIAPTDKDAYSDFKRDRYPPEHYERFSASIYSLENSFPLVKLGQVDRWQPDPTPPESHAPARGLIRRVSRYVVSPGFLRGFRRFQILLGWVLATLFAAGVTGVVRKD